MNEHHMAPKECALKGLHDSLWNCIAPFLDKLPVRKVLDVGCGQGAFVSRFAGLGHYTVACDVDGAKFKGTCDRFLEVNLDGDCTELLDQGPFGLVISQEIIEHLENPFAFMRRLGKLTADGGVCVVTTPNNQDKSSRIDFLFNGEFPWFTFEHGIPDSGHISPITLPLFYLMAASAGFTLERFCGFGERVPLKLNWRGRLFERYLDRKMNGNCLSNVINIWVLRKAAADTSVGALVSPQTLAKARLFMEKPCEILREEGV